MKYEIGDKIIVLHSDEEGIVVDFINDKLIMIEVRGVRFPAYMDQIDFPYYKMFTQKKVVEKKKIFIDQVRKEKPVKRERTGTGIRLRFFPVYDKDIFDDDVVEKLKIYLENNHDTEYAFHYHLYFGSDSHFEPKNSVRGLTDFYLHDVDFEDLSDNPTFSFDFSLAEPIKGKADHYEVQLKLRGKQFFKKIEEAKEKNEPSFVFDLLAEYPDKEPEVKVDLSRLGKAGFRMYEASKAREHMLPPRSVVDLHIEKLTDNWHHLSNQDILSLQLNQFEKYFELAVAHMLPDMIFIHGVGEGRLRDEIHERLRHKHEVKSFVNQYHHLYGYGATEIYFN